MRRVRRGCGEVSFGRRGGAENDVLVHWRSIAAPQWCRGHLSLFCTDLSRVSSGCALRRQTRPTTIDDLNSCHVFCPMINGILRSICPANCAGRGECDFSLSPPQCECFDRSDKSPLCASSPWSFAPTISPAPTDSLSPSSAPTFSSRPTEIVSSGGDLGWHRFFPSVILVLLLSATWIN
jgi:hypothetical protein